MSRPSPLPSPAHRLAVPLLIAACAAVAPGPAGAAETFAIDPAHSEIGFGVKHMVISTVKGKFTGVDGTITYDPDDIASSSVEVTIDASTIDTNNEDRDEHLRSPDFFDVAEHPTITFRSTGVEKRGSGHVARGVLTMHGVSKEIELPFEITGRITDPWGNVRIGIDVEPFELDRREFGLTWSKALETGGLVVGNDIELELHVEAIEKK